MKVSIDTKEDSHEDIRKVIKMLQNIVGGNQEIFTNQPISEANNADTQSAFTNIFGDTSASSQTSENAPETTQEAKEETSESTEDLFAELFSEEEIKKMDTATVKDEEDKEEEASKTKDKKYSIEFY